MSIRSANGAARPAARLLVFVPPRRSWPGGARGTLSVTSALPYVALDSDGGGVRGAAPLGALPRARQLDLVFDSLDVFSASITAPALGEARMRQALPNLLEERMLADPADCHFAMGGTPAEGAPLSVAAIERATLTRVLEACSQAQLAPRAAYSELYTLPPPRDGRFGLRVSAGGAFLRTGRDQGCRIELDEGGSGALALAVRQLGIARLLVYGPPSDAIADLVKAVGVEAAYAAEPVDAAGLAEAVNLLQGAYVPSGNFGISGRLLTRLTRNGAWRAPAAWLGACALIAVGGLNAYWLQLDGRFQDLRAAMHRTFRDGFPNESDAYLLEQARRSVAALRARAGRASAGDFSVLNAQALQWLATAPVGIVSGIDYADSVYRVRFKPGGLDDPAMRNLLQARAPAQGLAVQFDADGSARLTPPGS